MSVTGLPRGGAVLATMVVLAALLAGCTDDASQAQAPQASSSTSTPPQPDTPSPDNPSPSEPAAPALPAAAKEDTKAGAKAFVAWYVDLFNYSANSGDVAVFKQYGQDCDSCQNYASEISATYAQGGAFKGVHWADDRYYVDDAADGYFVSVDITASPYFRRTAPKRKFEKAPAETFELSFQLARMSRAFTVEAMRVPS